MWDDFIAKTVKYPRTHVYFSDLGYSNDLVKTCRKCHREISKTPKPSVFKDPKAKLSIQHIHYALCAECQKTDMKKHQIYHGEELDEMRRAIPCDKETNEEEASFLEIHRRPYNNPKADQEVAINTALPAEQICPALFEHDAAGLEKFMKQEKECHDKERDHRFKLYPGLKEQIENVGLGYRLKRKREEAVPIITNITSTL